MRPAIPALLIGLTVATSAIAQSGGGGGSSGGGASSGSASSSTTSGATTGAGSSSIGSSSTGSSSTGTSSSGTTTGVAPRSGSAESNAPFTINDQLRTNSGNTLRSPPPATGVAPGATVGQSATTVGQSAATVGQSRSAGARRCSTADCSSPLQGRYMALVDSMVAIAGVPRSRR
jgi:hypothetical protein